MSSRPLIIGSRGSRLALRQAEITLEALQAAHPDIPFEVRTIRTSGDASQAPLSSFGGRGVFVIEIERALLAGEIDIAVHSLKDLPSEETAGLTIAAVLPREDPRDVLVTRTGGGIDSLAEGAVVGTGSPRRAAAIRSLRPGLRIAEIRGNVDTRIRKVEDGEYDAAIIAAAGLARLGWLERASQVFDVDQIIPAVGQGALAVQTRTDDEATTMLVSDVDDPDTRVATMGERAFEQRLGGGCHAAVAAYGDIVEPGTLRLRGCVGGGDGQLIRGEMDGPDHDAEAIGVALAERLIDDGAAVLLAHAERESGA